MAKCYRLSGTDVCRYAGFRNKRDIYGREEQPKRLTVKHNMYRKFGILHRNAFQKTHLLGQQRPAEVEALTADSMSHRQASSRLKKGSAKKQHVNRYTLTKTTLLSHVINSQLLVTNDPLSVPKPPLLFSDSEDDLDYEGITREAATTSSSNTAQSPTTRASPPIAVNSSDQPKGDAVKIPTSTINRVNEATPGPSVKQSKDVSTNEPPIR